MQPRTLGMIAVVALVLAGVLLGITLVWRRGPEPSASVTPTSIVELEATSSPTPEPSPIPSQPMTYTVESGDTLSAVAQEHNVSLEALISANDLTDPDVLQVGQVLVIPEDEEPISDDVSVQTPEPGSSADAEDLLIPPTLTPAGPSLVEISEAVGVGTLESETISLGNQGGMVNLEAWTLSSAAGEQFVFPALTLFPEGQVKVHSKTGEDTPRDLYWGRTEPAWQEGELVTLRDADGNVVDTYILPEQ